MYVLYVASMLESRYCICITIWKFRFYTLWTRLSNKLNDHLLKSTHPHTCIFTAERDECKDEGGSNMEWIKLYKPCFFEVGSTQAENLSTHGMSGVLNESEHERAYEGGRESRVSVEPESHTFTPKFNEEAMKHRSCWRSHGRPSEFMWPSAVYQNQNTFGLTDVIIAFTQMWTATNIMALRFETLNF